MSRLCIGVLKETALRETLVALAPSHVPLLVKAGLEVSIESGAGDTAGFVDDAYRSKGARIIAKRDELFSAAQILLQGRTLGANSEKGRDDLSLLRPDHTVIGLADPLGNPQASLELATRGVTSLALELTHGLPARKAWTCSHRLPPSWATKPCALRQESYRRLFRC